MIRTVYALVIGLVLMGTSGYFSYNRGWNRGVVDAAILQAQKPVQEAPKALPVVEKTSVAPTCVSRKYTVVSGDNLTRVARKEYGGRGYLYPLLIEVNKLENPDLIRPGQVLNIPCCLCDLPATSKKVVTRVRKTSETKVKEVKKVASVVEAPKAEVAPAPQAPPVATPAQASAPAVAMPVPVAQPAPVPAPPVVSVPPTQSQKETVVVPERASLEQVSMPAPYRGKGDAPFVRTAPGSAWNSYGVSPIEEGNRVDYFHVDQGVILARLSDTVAFVPYVAVNATKDSLGYTWDNKVKGEAGAKLVKSFSQGIVSIGTAYAVESRKGVGGDKDTKSGVIAFTDGWFGWDQTVRSTRRSFLSSTPGSGWWNVGNTSPFEKDNLIGLARVEQGVTLAKAKNFSLIPQAWGQAGFDTKGEPWNNRYVYGGGMKVAVPWSSGVLSATAGYECAKQHGGTRGNSSSSAICGPRLSVDVWTGWRKKIGGQ